MIQVAHQVRFVARVMKRIPDGARDYVLRRDQVESSVLGFVDQPLGMVDVDLPIEQRGFAK
jgi:hypothetical protein